MLYAVLLLMLLLPLVRMVVSRRDGWSRCFSSSLELLRFLFEAGATAITVALVPTEIVVGLW